MAVQWQILVGHRGSGKSQLLNRLKQYAAETGHDQFKFIDLDIEIERREGSSITEIFSSQGERAFREIEGKVFSQVVLENGAFQGAIFIALGAGFEGQIPDQGTITWVRRPTDKDGRIFLDRPRLNGELTPFQEYFERFYRREEKYQSICTEVLDLPEGFTRLNDWERLFFGFREGGIGGWRTLMPWEMRKCPRMMDWWNKRKAWGLTGVELRDDFFSLKEIEAFRDVIGGQCLLSVRAQPQVHFSTAETLWDWPVEMGVPPQGMNPPIISVHERSECLEAGIPQLPTGAHIKWAPVVNSVEELIVGHRWWSQMPMERSFLPRSASGRWSWYRQLFGPKMKMAFWREGVGSAHDQPPMAEWVRTLNFKDHFAAVLGDPVHHSHTPGEQESFFSRINMPVVAISLSEEEMRGGALDALADMGLRAAAVTSPLKEMAYQKTQYRLKETEHLGALNTLVWDQRIRSFLGTNTDVVGAADLLARADGETVVWGGGGTKKVLKDVLPHAHFASMRSQTLEGGKPLARITPQVLVWAVGRSRIEGSISFPPADWRPQTVIDLNYSEDSPGREYALMVGAKYISGIEMFKSQARAQREFWSGQDL